MQRCVLDNGHESTLSIFADPSFRSSLRSSASSLLRIFGPPPLNRSPDGIVCYKNGTLEALEVKNHSPFSISRNPTPRFCVRDNKPNAQLAAWYVPQAMLHIYNIGPECGSCLFVRQTATKGATVVRVRRNDEWLKECFHYISEFKARFVDEGARLKQDFFFEEERYQRFLDLTMEIAKNVENVGFVEHRDVQRPRARKGEPKPSLFVEDYE